MILHPRVLLGNTRFPLVVRPPWYYEQILLCVCRSRWRGIPSDSWWEFLNFWWSLAEFCDAISNAFIKKCYTCFFFAGEECPFLEAHHDHVLAIEEVTMILSYMIVESTAKEVAIHTSPRLFARENNSKTTPNSFYWRECVHNSHFTKKRLAELQRLFDLFFAETVLFCEHRYALTSHEFFHSIQEDEQRELFHRQ